MSSGPQEPRFPDDLNRRRALSALMDGDVDAASAARVCGGWREEAGMRSDWHAYQLIGDVLRSDDLAQTARHDEAFLAALRGRLALEAVVLAPVAAQLAPTVAPTVQLSAMRRRRGWVAPLAVAAGFVAVAGVLVVTRVSAPLESGGPLLAAAPSRPLIESPVVAASSQALVADGRLIRDTRLDRYLAAHKQYGSSSALAVPGVVMLSSTTLAPDR